MNTFVISRNRQTGYWQVTHNGVTTRMDGLFTSVDARTAVIRVQRDHPDAEVGVDSKVFGTATELAFGPVVWIKNNLEAA